MSKIADVSSNDGETVQKTNGGNANILAADADTLPLQLSKDGVSVFTVGKDVPLTEVVDSLDEGRMPLRGPARVVSVSIDVSQPSL